MGAAETREIIYERQGILTRLQAIADGIIRVTRTGGTAFRPTVGAAVVPRTEIPSVLSEHREERTLRAGGITARVHEESGAISFFDREGNLLLREPERQPCEMEAVPVFRHEYGDAPAEERQSADGVRASAEPLRTVQDRTAWACRQHFRFNAGEGLYGLGSHEEGYGNLRGKSRLLYQHNLKACVPVLVSTAGWGLLFDMGCFLSFHDDAEGTCVWADCADEMDWYFFRGDGSYKGCMERYRLLTGETPLLPRYALGYIQSKERYMDAGEMEEIVAEYRRRRVPLDMIVLDWQSWPEGQWGWKTLDPARFPDPEGWLRRLHDQGVRLMISVWPSMRGEDNQDRKEMLEHGCMLGNRLIYDAFSPEARERYWRQARDHLFRYGVDAWWCDCSEPFESDWHGTIRPEAFQRAIINTEEAKKYLDPARISLYSLYHTEGIYRGQRNETGAKRVCILTRSSWAGQHRYAAVTWSGDVSADWETLRRQIPEGLNFCATGEPYWSTDIGGFFVRTASWGWFVRGRYDRGAADPAYRELFVRWTQFAVFLPMMRAHGTDTPREIWRFGEPGEPFYDAIEKAIRLRYRLIPWLYSRMAECRETGLPMLRVPALVFPEDSALRRIDDQMMLGDAILVKPVTHSVMTCPEENGDSEPCDRVSIRLPEGHRWCDPAEGIWYDGGEDVTVHAPIDRIPLFVRSGSILTLGAEADNTDEQAKLPLDVVIFPGEDGEETLYQDAGDGYGYEQGECSRVRLTWEDRAGRLTIGAREGSWPGMKEEMILRIRRFGETPEEIRYRGEPVVWT